MKKLLSLLSIISLSFVITACGGEDARSEMQMMGRYNSELMSASSAEEFHKAADNLTKFSVEAMNKRPSTVKSDEEFNAYQQAMKKFIEVVMQADQLAQQGKLADAKALTLQLSDMKKQYHAEFKNK
ncbi:cytochrome b562 [Pasteurella bettyae]|uniref:Cytochrome b562 n=1 Tax=Pasteurella bettyae CCUG 2042 TaxID=1095749 RepID=I3DJH1_9PAST|nr:cytochrome b562 [Pasteurella bettyae]EIJ71864.1 cytochrome b562 [Pasteurella bettyae CCUG 2042]SUB22438.1 cytochrome b562 family protein [Pasteurella bettyae]